ncbi:MAG TPA: hypothetical protein VMT86_14015 [Bryobacteraceae bacterium]|nr:hypothetical protein [Bryobacteraceae bacterium]
MGSSRRILAYAAGFALFAWFVFLIRGSLSCWFDADDLMNMHRAWERPWSTLLWANVTFWSSYYRPGGALLYRSLYACWGFHPLPLHIAAFVFLCADFALLAAVVYQLTESRWAALLALLLVGINPTFSAAYFYTGNLYDILAYLFFWAVFVFYVCLRRDGRVPGLRELIILLCLFVAALNAKEIAVSLPPAVALYELIWHPPNGWRWITQEGRFASIGALFDSVYIIGKQHGPDTLYQYDAYRPHYSLSAYIQSLSHYLHELLYRPSPDWHWQILWVIAGMTAIAAVTRLRCLIWSIGFILIGVLPLSFIATRTGSAYLLPAVGWAVYGAGLASWLVHLIPARQARLRTAVQVILLALLFVLLAPWQYRAFAAHARAVHEAEARFIDYHQQIHSLIPNPPKGAHILLLTDAGGYTDWDVYFLIRLSYADPSLQVERMSVRRAEHKQTNLATYDYLLDWAGRRFVLVKYKPTAQTPARPKFGVY